MLRRDLFRKAKIVSTLGPSSNTVEKIEELIRAGIDVARVNMSHGTHEGHREVIKNIREASRRAEKEVAILLDLQGPKIRVDKLKENLELKNDEEWFICPSSKIEKYKTNDKLIPTVYEDLVKDARVGRLILFDDGLIEAQVIEKQDELLKIKIIVGGILKSNKGINLPDTNVSAPSFTEKDREDLLFGLKEGIDYVALSFVRKKEDILEVKYLLHELKVKVPIIAKIEKPEAIINIREIVETADAIMVARGDMGVEVGNHLVPSIQKKIIGICNETETPVITATQMLESMITNSRPTRAEASDVANAIWDGTDAVMLSGETASGAYPVKAVAIMESIIKEAEKIPKERPPLKEVDLSNVCSSLQVAASLVAEKTMAKWILSFTQSGNSCKSISNFRPKTRVLGVTRSLKAVRRMCLFWGVSPYLLEDSEENIDQWEQNIINEIRKIEKIENGDKIVITYGDRKIFDYAQSNSIRVEIIKDRPKHVTDDEGVEEVSTDKGRILLDTSVCASCQNCIDVCPYNIWQEGPGPLKNTFLNKSNAHLCTMDAQCVEVCPTGAIEIHPKN